MHNSRDLETNQVSSGGWPGREDVACTRDGTLLSQRNEEVLPFVTARMDREEVMLSK